MLCMCASVCVCVCVRHSVRTVRRANVFLNDAATAAGSCCTVGVLQQVGGQKSNGLFNKEMQK